MNTQSNPSPHTEAPVAEAITAKLNAALAPVHLEVVNESGSHNVAPGSETHFKVTVVSPQFEGKRLLQRHRMVYSAVGDELRDGVHALAVHAFTEADWPDANGAVTDSPACRGGMAGEAR